MVQHMRTLFESVSGHVFHDSFTDYFERTDVVDGKNEASARGRAHPVMALIM
jgi:hypothetical protein